MDIIGRLPRHGSKWRAWFGEEYEESEVIEAVHKNETGPSGWYVYPPEQIDAALELGGFLLTHYNLRDVVGHEDIAPKRNFDPGPAFPMHSFNVHLFSSEVAFRQVRHFSLREKGKDP